MALEYIFAGLGNPGTPYLKTRHNAGAEVVEELAIKHRIPLDRSKYRSLVGQGNISGRSCLLALPQTYMNLSGQAVKRMLTYTGTPPVRLVVIHDDLDLPLGRIRMRAGGGAGGHRGIGSVIASLQTGDFLRLKIGIGRPPAAQTAEDFVLRRFNREERSLFLHTRERAVEALESLVADGLEKTMSLFNSTS
jgi:PTH1 family peptidyl-tRNA hydrolase